MENGKLPPLALALLAKAKDRTPEQWALIDRLNWGIPLTEEPFYESADHSES